ncbi:unnamed protein product, partial [Staurois parvus]
RAPVSLPKLKKAYEKGIRGISWGPLLTPGPPIGDHGAPVSLPKLKKAYEKGTKGISWGPLLTPGPRAVPEFPNGQSAPGPRPTNFIGITAGNKKREKKE